MIRIDKIWAAAAVLVALSSCAGKELGPTIPVPSDQSEGSSIDAPSISIIDVKTDGFTAVWDIVSDAKYYEYSFDGGETMQTEGTLLQFSGLEVDTEHIFRMRAMPRTESGRLPSSYVSVNVITSEIQPLDMPALKTGSSSTTMTVISWGAVPGAIGYEWMMEGRDTVFTDRLFLTLEGLSDGEGYIVRVRSIAAGDNTQKTDSDWAEISFTAFNDGSEVLSFSNFTATSDGISFDVYGGASQYWWYEIIPKTEYLRYNSHEEYLDSVKSKLSTQVEELSARMTSREAWASVLKSGSAAVNEGAWASLHYMVTVFGMDLEGNFTTSTQPRELITPSDSESDGPSYIPSATWFSQTLSLGTATSDTSKTSPTKYISIVRKGTGIEEVFYKTFSTSSFIKNYGQEMDDEAVSKLQNDLMTSGAQADSSIIAKINSTSGCTTGSGNKEPGTGYTVAALATSKNGAKALCVNSIRTRTSVSDNCWLRFSFSRTQSSLTINTNLKDGLDAVSAKYLFGLTSDITGQYSRIRYKEAVISIGTDMTDSQISSFNENGRVALKFEGLEANTLYTAIVMVTNSCGDVTLISGNFRTNQ